MYTKTQLELISLLLDGGEITIEDRKTLSKTTESALWQVSNQLSAKELRAIEKAEREGKVQIVGIITPTASDVARKAWMQPDKPTRMKPQPVLAKTGAELLAFLGVKG